MFFEAFLAWLLNDRWPIEWDDEDPDPEYTAREVRGDFDTDAYEIAADRWHMAQADRYWDNYYSEEPRGVEDHAYDGDIIEVDECELAEDNR